MNFGRKMKAGVAALAAIATLGAGGVVASTAFAGGGGGNQPGEGGDLVAVQFWQYKDDASGAWGPATSLDSVRAAMNNAGVTLEGGGVTKAQAALDLARTECETGFQRRHPGEGNGDCRVVAVGAVPAVFGGNYIYNGSGWYSPTGTGGWYDNWNQYVAPYKYYYAGTQEYGTATPFSDDPSNSVDAIMRRNVGASSKPSIVVIVLDKYQPAPPSYHLSVSTQAAEMSGQSGDTKDASDTITLSSDGSKTENVNGTATLHWRGVDGTEKTVAKQFTSSNKGNATVSASYTDMDASWESWPAGKRWWDVDVAKQGNMAEAVSHKGENDGKESGEKTTTPPEKWLTNEAGDTVRDGNDSIASGSLYTAHIKAHSNASGKFWIYDTIDTKDVVIGGTEKDGVSKVTVTDAHGNPISVVDAMLSAEKAAATETVTPHLCYYSPRIPGNTGSAIRLCAVTGTILHLVEPLGFNLRDTKLRRAGLDYHDMAHVVLHPNFDNLVESMPNSRIIAFTAHATKLYTEVEYKPTDILLFGPEPGDIPDPMDIMAGPHVAEQVRLPMRPSLRSLNLTNCASIAIYEAWRQLDFQGGR